MTSDSYDGAAERSTDTSYVARDPPLHMPMRMNRRSRYHLTILTTLRLARVDFHGHACRLRHVDCELGDYDDDVNCDSN